MRIGYGYDVHKLVEDRDLIIGGVNIAHEKGLLGHSDADVLVHALCDALLGAAALGDIGAHFPDNNEAYRGISSLILLGEVAKKIGELGFTVSNIDCTIAAERPKLAPYIKQMRMNIAQELALSIDQVSVKATTTEGLGFEGRQEGIAATAVVLLIAAG